MEQLGLEENFAKLEQSIRLLEKEDIPLEEAFKVYMVGMTLLKKCKEQIDRVEKNVLKITEDGCLEEFDGGEQ